MARRTKEEAEQTRKTLLETALALFSEKGLANVTLAQIASAAGVTRGAIYWHFKDKSLLIEALENSVFEPLEQKFDQLFSDDPDDPLKALCGLGKAVFQQAADDPLFRSMSRIMQQACFDPQMIDRFKKITSQEDKCMADLMNRAHEKGVLRSDISAEAAAMMVTGFFQGVIERWMLASESVNLAEDGEIMMITLIDGLRSKS